MAGVPAGIGYAYNLNGDRVGATVSTTYQLAAYSPGEHVWYTGSYTLTLRTDYRYNADGQQIELGPHETAEGIFRCAHDGFAAHIEAGIGEDRAAGQLLEARQQRVITRVGRAFEESADVGEVEVVGVACFVEEDEAAGPVGVGFGVAVLAEALAGGLADEVEQARRLGGTWGWGLGGYGESLGVRDWLVG